MLRRQILKAGTHCRRIDVALTAVEIPSKAATESVGQTVETTGASAAVRVAC
jgi:hypothetical protein